MHGEGRALQGEPVGPHHLLAAGIPIQPWVRASRGRNSGVWRHAGSLLVSVSRDGDAGTSAGKTYARVWRRRPQPVVCNTESSWKCEILIHNPSSNPPAINLKYLKSLQQLCSFHSPDVTKNLAHIITHYSERLSDSVDSRADPSTWVLRSKREKIHSVQCLPLHEVQSQPPDLYTDSSLVRCSKSQDTSSHRHILSTPPKSHYLEVLGHLQPSFH